PHANLGVRRRPPPVRGRPPRPRGLAAGGADGSPGDDRASGPADDDRGAAGVLGASAVARAARGRGAAAPGSEQPVSERADELAVLRPTPGDVIVIYADVYQIVDAELLSRQMVELRHAGVHVLFVPSDAVVSRLRSEEHTSELQSLAYLVCRLLLEK